MVQVRGLVRRPGALATALVVGCGVLVGCGYGGAADPTGAPSPAAPPASTSTSSPPGTSPPAPGDAPSKTAPTGAPTGADVRAAGTVEAGVEPGCLLLVGGGETYLLLDLPGPVETGALVEVVGRADPGVVTTCQQGTPLVVTELEVLPTDAAGAAASRG